MRKGFFTYAWDLQEEGIEPTLDAMIERYACNAIAVTASYHSARELRPRLAAHQVYTRPGAAIAFQPQPARYEGGPLPIVETPLAEANVLGRTRDACAQRDMDLAFWLVGLHNSTLGGQQPELCAENAFGDRYTYNLCPSNPAVRAYLRGLVGDACAQFRPQRILLETPSFLGLLHWVHHEKIGVPLSEAAEMLGFLCFCPHCLARAEAAGIDGPALRQQVRQLWQTLMGDERGAMSPAYAIADMPALLIEYPELYAYIRMRLESTASLVTKVRAAAQEQGTALEVMPSAFGTPITRAWREGVSLRRLAQVADGVMPLTYFSDPREVRADLRWTKMACGDTPMSVGMTACHPVTTSAGMLAANAAVCAEEGAAGVYYYNYGMLNQERLDWVGQANRQGE